MKKAGLISGVIILVIGIIISCKKNETPETPETAITTPTKQRTIISFDKADSLSIWTASPAANLSIDNNVKAVGVGALKISNNTSCLNIFTGEGITVKKSTNYKISIKSRIDSTSRLGADLCAWGFTFSVKENNKYVVDNQMLIHTNVGTWFNNTYFFKSDDTGLPIIINLNIGYKYAMFDQLVIEEL